ncbi:hypothetical protein QJS10_CPA01g01780 [Acorus calamus]|uniref:Uncharacterized protein n=1 Tax=Acorus calamus TaxID=4465 RepID=A0AAV9FGC8_ACOCL|nr:hypothetical protein QJS10_CPA01g01780 [Acorus calamus]
MGATRLRWFSNRPGEMKEGETKEEEGPVGGPGGGISQRSLEKKGPGTQRQKVGGGCYLGRLERTCCRGKVAIGHSSLQYAFGRGLSVSMVAGTSNRDGPSIGLWPWGCPTRIPLNQVVEGGQLSKAKGTGGEASGMGDHVNGLDFPCISDLGSSGPVS